MLKSVNDALTPDPRFTSTWGVDGPMTFADHHNFVEAFLLSDKAPQNVSSAFQRALHCWLYAWFDYELLIVAETQALASVELALKMYTEHVAPKAQGFSTLVDIAVKHGLLDRLKHDGPDDFDYMIRLRNDLAHGTSDIHTPAMAIRVFEWCHGLIIKLYP